MMYPRLYVTQKTHDRVKRIAKKQKTSIKDIGEKIVKAGISTLNY